MIEIILMLSLGFLALSMMATIFRLVIGPTIPDRVQALDILGINLISAVAILSVLLKTHAFMEVILLIGILSFIGTIAFARFMERGVVIERRRHK
ncbi:Na(+)/H(+) antiporter subunit F1 [Cytobacillus firmus]|jgi:multicomponent Na+:H+ antiporter subunit F|uniref:Na(+) H(+) antiporter subunit F n=1 Tax=Cytobacillus firmus TaxID=1399 RepID=A0A380XZD4_CYTFI|nr:Na(+)/H(+) antiporter subunit F1 [Cytobacillus firmus]KAF0823660.1 Na(+) H(+) antiporter subunit F [Cytobacillus firmus]MBG9543523.1 monovalent cation/H+ antiporter subunit F [Cytobacillus firmus]MBG9549442.1 monovalent cation/H+ antiporter subunit F [Cytobacillus firmus]MBG9554857.1 monovalent cation/H+ antiporter subunit F [Cytobacillus firmus]MBG9559569.1 monovalent cation/H+ antiporter subunit F [Cytobacillus firmus]